MDRSHHRTILSNKLSICLYAIIVGVPFNVTAFAESDSGTTNIAGPTASATGNVTNQAVQVLQGPYAVNTFGSGVSCQGPTMSLAPFALGNFSSSADPTTYQSNTGNFGMTLGFNFPLDGSIQELCKSRARVEITRQQAEADKARLDFELVRLIKCGEAMKNGIYFHPQSPYAKICSDIVVNYPRIQNLVNGIITNQSSKN